MRDFAPAISANWRRGRRRTDASRSDVVRRAVEHDRDLARLTLAALLGLDTDADSSSRDVRRL